MTLDRLAITREKLKNKEIMYLVPYHTIQIGKKVIKNTDNLSLSEALLYKNSITNKDLIELDAQATSFPNKYYEPCKVCYQCYQIYTFIMKQHRTRKKLVFTRKDYKGKFIENLMNSELGPLNKDNINDLLADISFFLVSSENDCDERVKNMYSSMTELHKSRHQEKLVKDSFIKVNRTSISKSTEFDIMPSIQLINATPNKSRCKVILSKVGEFYIGKPKKKLNRIIIK